VERWSECGPQTAGAAHDENSVVVTKKQTPEFEALRDTVEAAKARALGL
jgi:hypothetical protein